MEQYTFYALISRMKLVERWGLMRSIHRENLMEHTCEVAMLGQALAIIANEKFNKKINVDYVATLALYHDMAEVVSGDLPTPVKYYNKDIMESYKAIENNIIEQMLEKVPDFTKETYTSYLKPDENSEEFQIMKIADKLSAYVKCVEEMAGGNKEFELAKENLEKILVAYWEKYPELKFFMQKCLPSYGKQLDLL